MTGRSSIRAVTLNCSLKRSGNESSSTDVLLDQIEAQLRRHDVDATRTRIADLSILPGTSEDEGPGDEWPDLRRQVLDAEILVLATPIWLGHPSSLAQRVLERLDAMIGQTDADGRQILTDRVALVGVVGNEDGAHHVGAELFQGLNDIGFSLPAGAMTYWVGEAMGSIDFQDLEETPDKVASTTATMVANGVHLARLLVGTPYPAAPDSDT